MQVHVNTNSSVAGKESLAKQVEAVILRGLSRFDGQITRVEVHLGDENRRKAGPADKRCLLEARVTGRRPVSATHYADTLEQAVSGATSKMARSLDTSLGKAGRTDS